MACAKFNNSGPKPSQKAGLMQALDGSLIFAWWLRVNDTFMFIKMVSISIRKYFYLVTCQLVVRFIDSSMNVFDWSSSHLTLLDQIVNFEIRWEWAILVCLMLILTKGTVEVLLVTFGSQTVIDMWLANAATTRQSDWISEDILTAWTQNV